jgi:hypothetical protein
MSDLNNCMSGCSALLLTCPHYFTVCFILHSACLEITVCPAALSSSLPACTLYCLPSSTCLPALRSLYVRLLCPPPNLSTLFTVCLHPPACTACLLPSHAWRSCLPPFLSRQPAPLPAYFPLIPACTTCLLPSNDILPPCLPTSLSCQPALPVCFL